MDLFHYDYDELALCVQRKLDRLAINFLRNHHARVHLDDVDFHGVERVDLEVKHDGHHLMIKQAGLAEDRAAAPGSRLIPEMFESTFDGKPTSEAPVGLLAQWLALLPVGELATEKPSVAVDPANPFLAEKKQKEGAQPTNPFLPEASRAPVAPNPFAPDAGDKKKRAALDWLKAED